MLILRMTVFIQFLASEELDTSLPTSVNVKRKADLTYLLSSITSEGKSMYLFWLSERSFIVVNLFGEPFSNPKGNSLFTCLRLQ